MGICPNCGSWVDEGDICHGCGGSGSYSSSNDEDNTFNPPVESQADKLGKKAWELYLDAKYDDALYYINQALDLNRVHVNNWNMKAIILEYMERYAESEKCYNRSLELCSQKLVYENKARMLRSWAGTLLTEARSMDNGLIKLEEALQTNKKAIDALPSNTEENMDNYISQKHIIESTIQYEKEYHDNIESLKSYDKSELFTITGGKFYKVGIRLTPGMSLKLVKEPNNEFDKDAIAVYVEDKKVGYVANREYTKLEITSSASELQDKIPDVVDAQYIIHLIKPTNIEYPDIEYHIGRIIK